MWDGLFALADLEQRFEDAKTRPKKDYHLLKTLKQVAGTRPTFFPLICPYFCYVKAPQAEAK
jgi:hypothetical protein